MKPEVLRKWMDENGKNEVDIASAVKVHPITVSRFLKGVPVRRIILDALTRLVNETPPTKKVVG